MIASPLLFGLLGLAAATPAATNYPATQSSTGFRLVVNVTDLSKDFKSSIQNTFVASIHTGAGLALVGIAEKESDARVFYENGTAKEVKQNKATVVTDGGVPPFPQGLKLIQDPKSTDVATANLDVGYGTKGVQLATIKGYTYLNPQTYVACNESVSYYGGEYFILIKHANTITNKDGSTKTNIPKGCAPVRLIPECATLDALPKGSMSSHKYAVNSKCYKDVSALKWSKYSS